MKIMQMMIMLLQMMQMMMGDECDDDHDDDENEGENQDDDDASDTSYLLMSTELIYNYTVANGNQYIRLSGTSIGIPVFVSSRSPAYRCSVAVAAQLHSRTSEAPGKKRKVRIQI